MFIIRSSHIPYRDSKLTRILQSSLSGNARIAVICTISPSHLNLEESQNTLKFAARVKRIVTAAATNEVCILQCDVTCKALLNFCIIRLLTTKLYCKSTGTRSTTCEFNYIPITKSFRGKGKPISPCCRKNKRLAFASLACASVGIFS